MSLISRILTLLFPPLFLFSVHAQEERLNFFHLTTENGLTANDISSIVQDSSGFLWFATPKGLNRYDGYNFTHYLHDQNDSLSLTDNAISTLFIDSEGTMWVGLANYGLCKYLPNQEGFMRYRSTDDTTIILGNTVLAMDEDDSGNIWISTNEGLNKLNKNTNTFKSFKSGSLIQEYTKYIQGQTEIVDLQIDRRTGNIWLAFHESVIGCYHPNTGDCKVVVFEDRPFFSSVYVHNQKVYAGSYNRGTKIYDLKSGQMDSETFDNIGYTVKDIRKGPDGNLWFCTTNGLIKFNPDNGSHDYYTDVEGDLLSMSGAPASTLFFGSSNIMWVAVDRDGINYTVRNKPFNHYYINANEFNSLSHAEISAMNLWNDEIQWIGYQTGAIEKFNLKNKTKTYYTLKNRYGNNSGTVFTIYTDKQGITWAGNWSGGLYKFSPKKHRFELFRINDEIPEPLEKHMDVRGICEDDSGQLWISVHGSGLFKLNTARNEYQVFKNNENDSTSISNNWVFDVEWDNPYIWVGTVWGLSRFDKTTGRFKRYFFNPDDSATISSNRINTISKDDKGDIWVGTHKGLNLYDRKNDHFIRILSSDKLVQDEIKSIQNDQNGNLWVAVSNGLAKLELKYNETNTPLIENTVYYNRNDGLQSYEFSENAVVKDKKGLLYFGGNKGIDYFDPDAIKDQLEIPPLKITSVNIFNKQFIAGHGDKKDDHFILHHDQNMLTFEFAVLSFLDAENNMYSFRLEGLEDEWCTPTKNRIASYSNLSPGSYTFMVRGANSDGTWNNNAARWQFVITPPWYGTWWFRFLTVMLTIAGIWAIFMYRIMSLRRKQVILETSVKERTKELQEKTAVLEKQTINLHQANTLLEKKQQQIEKQSTELESKSNNLAEINRQLNFTNNMKDKILSVIAHDLKNPFNTILGFSELLQTGYTTYNDEKRLRMVDYIYSSSKNAYNLLDNLLQWSRSQTNRLKISPQILDMNQLINENYNLLKDSFVKKHLTFSNQIKNDCTAYADPNLISTVVRNLLSNAVKFSFEGSSIEVSSNGSAKKVVIQVKDQGIGINKNDISSLFNIEVSLSREGTEGEAGTGLGLLLCKDFIEKSGGEIWVSSTSGKGSTFSFSLPTP